MDSKIFDTNPKPSLSSGSATLPIVLPPVEIIDVVGSPPPAQPPQITPYHHHHHHGHHHHHHGHDHDHQHSHEQQQTEHDSVPTPPLSTSSTLSASSFSFLPASTSSCPSGETIGIGTASTTAATTALSSETSPSSLICGESFSTKKLRLEIKSEPHTPHTGTVHQQSASASCRNSSSGSSAAVNDDLQSWQESKRTIKDRTSCLVNSERLSDVTFLVGQNETPVYGHKTILSVGSPYFEKLFFGPMAEKKSKIRIPDIEAEIFLTFLKYLYTDEFDSSMDDSDTLLLLKPAKVYIVPHLAEKCTALLVERMNPENVLVIYNRALIFDEPKLADFCLRFVDRQIDKIVSTENFLYMEAEILCTLLDRDNLRIDECTLFKAVVKWTEMECARQSLDFNSENSRLVLGRALYMIRFPTMAQEEFCLEVVPTDILKKDEVIGIFMNLCIGNEFRYFRPETPFNANKRVFRSKLHYLSRFSDVLSKVLSVNNSFGSTSDVLYSSKLRFQCDQRIFVHGLGVYGILSPIPSIRFNATASICKAQNLLSCKTLDGSARTYDFRMPFQVMFDKPVEVKPDEEYLLTAALKIVRDSQANSNSNLFATFGSNTHYGATVNIDSYYGTKAHSQVKITCTDGVVVNFTFHVPSCYHIGETFSLGQIPQLIFSV